MPPVTWRAGREALRAGPDHARSLCPECLAVTPATIEEGPLGVTMTKRCERHGISQAVICSDAATYRRLAAAPRKVAHPERAGAREHGCPADCGLCTAHDQRTCLGIMEITSRCGLGCPICLAGAQPAGVDRAPELIEGVLRAFRASELGPVALQLSGGEPTEHPAIVDIVRGAAALGFAKLEIDTNGLALARDPEMAPRLREAGLGGIYLQMDSLEPAHLASIRGRDLLDDKRRAIEASRRSGLEVVLSVTVVPGINDQRLWEIVRFGVAERLTGVNFQPVALAGRFPPDLARSTARFTLGHVLQELERQSEGQLRASDLLPIPCPDTRCGVMAWALVSGETLIPLNRVCGVEPLLDPMADFGDWPALIRSLRERAACGCGAACGPSPEDLGALLAGADFFSVGCHALMDAWSFDAERARRCCVHELTPDGKRIPFCLYNITRAAG